MTVLVVSFPYFLFRAISRKNQDNRMCGVLLYELQGALRKFRQKGEATWENQQEISWMKST